MLPNITDAGAKPASKLVYRYCINAGYKKRNEGSASPYRAEKSRNERIALDLDCILRFAPSASTNAGAVADS